MTRNLVCMFAVLATVLTVTGRAEVITPTNVTASSTLTGNPESNLLSSAGMTTTGDVLTWTWSGVSTGIWMSAGGTSDTYVPQTLLFNLGKSVSLSKIYVWNFSHDAEYMADYNTWDAKGFHVYASNAAGDLGTALGSGTLDMVTSLPVTNQAFDLNGTNAVQYVKVVIDSGYAQASPGYYVDLARVRFESIPEPCTYSLLATGLVALLCYAWKKRR